MSSERPTTPPRLAPLKRRCPGCGGNRLVRDYEAAEVVCRDCGFVVAEKMADKGPEWRAFNREQREKRRRVGAPFTFTIHDKGLTTTIDRRDRDARGRRLPPGQRAQVYRMRKWQRRTRVSDATERNLASALTTMSKTCSTMNLPKNIMETASVIYRRALKKRLIRGRSIQIVAAASVYMACRKCRIARTLDEVAHASGMERKDIGRCYRFMVKELREFVPPPAPSYYVCRFANHLELSGRAETIALRILLTAKKMRLTGGRGPLSIATAAIYIASVLINDRRTQREVAEVAGITEVTIRNRYKELVENVGITVKL
ncbi:MAG: transcription initiation factor IIB [Candidatus Bathyarchaeia archaeon]